MIQNEPVLSLTEFANIILDKKPYLVEIENKVQEVKHGRILLEIDIRNGSVDKMVFKELNKSWVREKAVQDVQTSRTIMVNFVQSF
jgi:hypothetical protein